MSTEDPGEVGEIVEKDDTGEAQVTESVGGIAIVARQAVESSRAALTGGRA